jgi:HTH-type transcriptional regulator / antitoxin HigA
MDITSLETPAEYEAALKLVAPLMDASADSPEGGRLDALVTLIESYEREHFPMDSLLD